MSVVDYITSGIKTIAGIITEYIWLIIAAVVLLFVVWASDTDVTYYVYESLLDSNFANETRRILQNTDFLGKITVREVSDPASAIITIKLTPRDKMDMWHMKKEYYPSGKEIRFSMTEQGWYIKPAIYIDSGNWINGVPESGLTLEQYREYVIRHEFMHGAGYDHQPCNQYTAINGVAPVLYQSTRGPEPGFKCGWKVTPIDFTKKLTPRYIW